MKSKTKTITIGTRASKLAMIQTRSIIERLQRRWPALDIKIEQIHTTGDRNTSVPLAEIGGDGVFVLEIERALLDGRIDLGVHSLKDLPTAQPDGLRVCAVGERADPRDVLVWNEANRASRDARDDRGENSQVLLPARVGTGSLRRAAQLQSLFPGIEILPLRGNVDTRLRKLDAGDYDGIVLASAGLHRLGAHQQVADRLTYLPLDTMLPAPGQGALALELRDEAAVRELIAPLNDMALQAATDAERAFMRRLGAGCYLPIAAYGEIQEGMLTLRGLVISLDGKEQVRVRGSMPWPPESNVESAAQLGVRLAEQAMSEGAAAIIQTVNEGRVNERA